MIRFAADNAFAVALRQIAANHGQGNDAEATHRRVGEMLRREGRHVDVNQLHNVTFLEVRDHLPPVDVLCPPPELLVHSIKLVLQLAHTLGQVELVQVNLIVSGLLIRDEDRGLARQSWGRGS